jgi:hypothetical protein
MNPHRKLATIAIVLVVLTTGTGFRKFLHLDPLREVGSYYPLAVGNRWVYVDSTGTEHEEVLSDHIGEFFYNPRTRLGTSHDPEGVKQAVFYKGIPRSSWFILKLPLRTGAIWSSEDLLYEITSTTKTVLVRAGTFRDCVEVRVRHKREFVTNREEGTVEAVLTITFAPGVGPVEWRTTIGNRVLYRKELVSFQLG